MRFLRRLRALFRRSQVESDMAEEMRAHLELEAAHHERRGLSAEEARYAAQRSFGGVEQIKERARDGRGTRWLEDAGKDLRYALRMLRRNPGFTAIAVLTVAVGVGANTAIFSVLNAVVLRPLPFPEPQRIVQVIETNPSRNITQFSAAFPNFFDWRKLSRSWEALSAIYDGNVNLQTPDVPERLSARFMTADALTTFGLRPLVGRGFLPEEEVKGGRDVVLLSEAFWRRAYAAERSVLNQVLILNGRSYTVVGVAPAELGLGAAIDVFLPIGPLVHERRSQHELQVYGRLKPGIALGEASAEMIAVARRIETDNPGVDRGWSVRLAPLFDAIVGQDFRSVLTLVLAAVGVLLLIACANLSSLLLVRASVRTRELAIRTALGGGRGRLMRQLVTESLLLAALGGVLGVVLAFWGVDFFRSLDGPRAEGIAIDGRVLIFGCAATLFTGLLSGIGPAWRASRQEVQHGLKGSASSPRRSAHGLRNALLVGQLALSIVLLAAGGLMLRTLHRLNHIDLGFKPGQVVTLQVDAQRDRDNFFPLLLERVAALPGVDTVGATSGPPMGGGRTALHVYPVGPAAIPNTQSVQSEWRVVSPDFFKALDIPLLKGRLFKPSDHGRAPKVVVVNQTFARTMWGDEDPIGKQVSPGGNPLTSTVVGVVGDVRSLDPATPPVPGYYMSIYRGVSTAMTLAIRTRGDAERIVPLVRAEVRALDPTAPVFEVRTMAELVHNRLTLQRVVACILGAFGACALMLTMVGLYGVMAFATAQRTREIGIRMALGAQRFDVLRPLLREGMGLILTGLVIGLVCALGVTRLMRGMLTEVSPSDPLTFAAATLLLGGVSLLACYLPARRATKVDPLIALKCE
jgi:predicted permease